MQQTTANIKSQLGLDPDPSNWSYEERISYIKALAKYIRENPAGFPEQSVALANKIEEKEYEPLVDTGFFSTAAQLYDEFLESAGEKISFWEKQSFKLAVFGLFFLIAGFYIFQFAKIKTK